MSNKNTVEFNAGEYKKLYDSYHRAADKCLTYLSECGVDTNCMPDASDSDECMCVAETLAGVYCFGPVDGIPE